MTHCTLPSSRIVIAGTSELTVGNVHIKAFDLGGHEAARKLWTTYFEQVDAVVYLIDCADVERFPEAKKELDVRFDPP